MKCEPGCVCGRHSRREVLSTEYKARHQRVRRERGKAACHPCASCDRQARDWAQIHTEDGNDAWADYVALCRPCHMYYDRDARVATLAVLASYREQNLASLVAYNEKRRTQAALRSSLLTDDMIKTCPRCKLPKPLSEFNRCRTRYDGRQSVCRQCEHDRRATREPQGAS